MTTATPRHAKRNGWVRWGALAAVIAMVCTGATLVGLAVDHQHQHDAGVSRAAAAKHRVDRRAAKEAARVQASTDPPPATAPTAAVSAISGPGATLVIPALGVRAPIVVEGATNGSMTIPSDITTVGWYDGLDSAQGGTTPSAPWPGQPGVALVAGHVDWAGRGPGALYYLNQLEQGDPIEVVGSNGVTTQWQVSQAPLTLSKATLPSSLFVNTGPPELAIVTCGGPFDAATGHYLDNVIVWASPVGAG